jgi:hypothetical protein
LCVYCSQWHIGHYRPPEYRRSIDTNA